MTDVPGTLHAAGAAAAAEDPTGLGDDTNNIDVV